MQCIIDFVILLLIIHLLLEEELKDKLLIYLIQSESLQHISDTKYNDPHENVSH